METSVEAGENRTRGEECFNLVPAVIKPAPFQSAREIAGQGQRRVVILLQVDTNDNILSQTQLNILLCVLIYTLHYIYVVSS